MNEQARPTDRPLETVRTETLPEGTLFVSPDGVLYQVVMAGSAGFRKAEPWPWPPHGWSSPTGKPRAVALVPGSLLARNYPVVAEGRPLPTVRRSDFLGLDDQPTHHVFPTERLAKLAARLDEKVAHQSGLTVQQERTRCILSDGLRTFRVYHYHADRQGKEVDLAARDAKAILTVLTIESMNPAVYTCVEILDPENVQHARRARADEVVVIGELSSRLLVRSAMDHGLSHIVSDLMSGLYGNAFYSVRVPASYVGRSIGDVFVQLKQERDTILIALERDGQQMTNPPWEMQVNEGDHVVVLARERPRLMEEA